MEDGSIPLLIVLIVLLLLSAYFSATETAFSSLNRLRLKNLASGGNSRAAKVLAMVDEYDKLLSTILIGNNIVNIVMASLATVLFVRYYGNAGVTISTIVMTVLVLIFGEITPKSIAKEAPEQFAMFSAPFLRMFVWLLTPLNWFFMLWKKLFSKLFFKHQPEGITEEEILLLVDEGNEMGTIELAEKQMINNVFEFDDLVVGDIMTHRTELAALPEEAGLQAVLSLAIDEGFSRIPIYRGDIDDIVGILYVKDLLVLLEGGIDKELSGLKASDFMRSVIYVAESTRCRAMFREFKAKKTHIAVVVDEYGGTAGVITMEDLLESIVGNIQDEYDSEDEEISLLEDDTYLLQGSVDVEEVEELFSFALPDNEESDTLGGLIANTLGRIPEEDETPYVDICGVRFTVCRVEDRRIISVTAKRLDDSKESNSLDNSENSEKPEKTEKTDKAEKTDEINDAKETNEELSQELKALEEK